MLKLDVRSIATVTAVLLIPVASALALSPCTPVPLPAAPHGHLVAAFSPCTPVPLPAAPHGGELA